jgi:HD-GYP domain-containing protein (c-di-GMP phosphodiesterase class II)
MVLRDKKSDAQTTHSEILQLKREFRQLLDSQSEMIQRWAGIGIALSAERDINRLLEMIIDEAMAFSNADAGTLYVVDEEKNQLTFQILKNKSMGIHAGGTSEVAVELPPVPLELNGLPNLTNASSQAALTGEVINIPDVYEAIGLDFSGTKMYDEQTGYRSKSMLVVPMKNHENEIIGVLQLLNAKSPETGEIIPFPKGQEPIVIALASQAAVALENARLIVGLKTLFDAFIQSIATAIDEKSAYTAGHIRRVTELTMKIAEAINNSESGRFEDVYFTKDELEELRIAAWLHDIGKITTPEHVVDKSTKLEGLFDRIELIRQRFGWIETIKKNLILQKKIELLEAGAAPQELAKLERQLAEDIQQLNSDMKFVEQCNTGTEFLSDEKLLRLQELAAKYVEWEGQRIEYLTPFELKNLSIRRGTLTDEERKIIENHVLVSIKMLQKVPFPRKLRKVPEYAGGHHEKLDGSGYPYGLTAEQLPIQARIMAIADIFEALTAKDRPYKKPMKLSKALAILRDMSERNHIDREILELFLESKIYLDYARKELNPEQIDIELQ